MIAPLLNRNLRNKFSIVAFFGLVFFFYHFYIQQDEPEAASTLVKVGSVNNAKQIGKTSPESAGLKPFIPGTPTTESSNNMAGGDMPWLQQNLGKSHLPCQLLRPGPM